MTAGRRRVAAAAVAASTAFFAVRLFRLVDRFSVNVLFWDEWDYLTGLREGLGPWKLFTWQHGPHRMGLGYLFIDAVFTASRWDDRAETFAIFGVFLIITALALLLKVRVAGPLTWMDACIPALVLSTAQFEVFVGTPNAAHGPIPLLLVVLSPFVWSVPAGPLRALLGGMLALCAAFTAFAIFLVPCLAAVFVTEAARPGPGVARRLWDGAGAVLCLGALALFFRGYQFGSSIGTFQFPDPHPLRYLPFAGMSVFRVMRLVKPVPIASTLAVAGCVFLVAAAAASAIRLLRGGSPLTRTLFIFAWFTALFAANAAIGRVSLGMIAALAPRYVPYEVPLWLCAYFALAAKVSVSKAARWAAAAYVAAILCIQVFVPDDVNGVNWYSEGKSRWRACYLRTQDEVRCNRETDFRVYPSDSPPQMVQMLEFLKRNRLNLFKPQEP